jgi:hypothetical protein
MDRGSRLLRHRSLDLKTKSNSTHVKEEVHTKRRPGPRTQQTQISSRLNEVPTERRLDLETTRGDTPRCKNCFLLNSSKITTESRNSPSSLPHLISGMKNEFLTHFYSRNYEMKLGRDNEPQPSKILYIGSIKRLNDYYTPMT